MTRRLLPLAFAAVVVVLAPTPAGAHEPTCVGDIVIGEDTINLQIENHGQHVTRDYVGDPGHGAGAAVPGGSGAHGHLLAGLAPGASFCNEGARSWGVPRGS